MLATLGVAVAGSLVADYQVVGRYKTAADQMETVQALSSRLTGTLAGHEALAHALWNGAPIDRSSYQRQQNQIISLFDTGIRELRDPDQRALLVEAAATWRQVLISRGLWAPSAAPDPGVTLTLQQQFAQASDKVSVTVSQLSTSGIEDGRRDLATADTLQNLVLGLLGAMFTLVVGIALYLARRMTTDVVRPLEVLRQAVTKLREGNLEHRIQDEPDQRWPAELSEVAGAFNAMAAVLDEQHRNLQHRATRDSLTGLPNRSSFRRQLEDQLLLTGQTKYMPGVLFIDIDDFKIINDSLGHAAGDAVLVQVAERLTACIGAGDLVARLGGDEFVILVSGGRAGTDAAQDIAERVLNVLVNPFTIAGSTVPVAVSIGIALARPNMCDAGRLLAEADLAMYTAKRNGKARHEVFHVPPASGQRLGAPER
ncbi:MAG TPA: diguanylate cyclase [Pseudonocardiaceae bacterium]|nr:diguanylate cyclase [Pseudonocardiaceae bacterium]